MKPKWAKVVTINDTDRSSNPGGIRHTTYYFLEPDGRYRVRFWNSSREFWSCEYCGDFGEPEDGVCKHCGNTSQYVTEEKLQGVVDWVKGLGLETFRVLEYFCVYGPKPRKVVVHDYEEFNTFKLHIDRWDAVYTLEPDGRYKAEFKVVEGVSRCPHCGKFAWEKRCEDGKTICSFCDSTTQYLEDFEVKFLVDSVKAKGDKNRWVEETYMKPKYKKVVLEDGYGFRPRVISYTPEPSGVYRIRYSTDGSGEVCEHCGNFVSARTGDCFTCDSTPRYIEEDRLVELLDPSMGLWSEFVRVEIELYDDEEDYPKLESVSFVKDGGADL